MGSNADQKVSYDVVTRSATRLQQEGEDLRRTVPGFSCHITAEQVAGPGVATAITAFFRLGGQSRDHSGGRVEHTGTALRTGVALVADADDQGADATGLTAQELATLRFGR